MASAMSSVQKSILQTSRAPVQPFRPVGKTAPRPQRVVPKATQVRSDRFALAAPALTVPSLHLLLCCAAAEEVQRHSLGEMP